MPSFDIVSEINLQEVDNAINQTLKEIGTRFDFKDSRSSVLRDKEGIHLESSDDFKLKALIDILQSKAVKRGVPLKALVFGVIEPAASSRAKCLVKLVQGIDAEKSKELVKRIKGTNLKLQAAIEGEKVRVSGKKRDDLQSVIQLLRSVDLSIPIQFINFRE